MSVALATSAAASAALAGFLLGVVAEIVGVSPLPAPAAAALVAVALLADFGPPPVCLRRQVPRLWGRVLAPTTAAVLYGARLGIGPLTILSTWLWWAGATVAATAGPWWSAGAGAAFAIARVAAMVAATTGAGPDMATRMASVRRREDVVRGAVVVVALSACVLVTVPLP